LACHEHAAVLFVEKLLAIVMEIGLTGANGFVGRHFTPYLTARGLHVVPLTRGVDIGPVLTGLDVVVHLAARVHVMNETSSNPLAEFRQSNVDATEALARQAAKAGVRRFVFMSSVKVNGEETQPGHAFRETDETHPQDAYGISKWEAELVLRQVAVETGMEVVIIRSPLVYGPGVKANFAALMRAVQRGWPLPFGGIKNVRSLVGLDNLMDFIYCCMTHPAAKDETFLVSDGHDVSSAQLVIELALALGVTPRIWSVPPCVLESIGGWVGKRKTVQRLCSSLQVDISKARQLLAWQPPVSLQEGFQKAVSKG
jgi:nucleoside-diphosphate-sugar epimerase